MTGFVSSGMAISPLQMSKIYFTFPRGKNQYFVRFNFAERPLFQT
jgi:hypothetical protein